MNINKISALILNIFYVIIIIDNCDPNQVNGKIFKEKFPSTGVQHELSKKEK